MEYVEILSPGDKLKLLRKKYRLKQEEISGNEITRNLISEIETNKANLTKSTAEIIFANLNVLSKKHKFDVTETIDYLMEDELSQANKILDEYIDELKGLFIYKDSQFFKTLKKVESFLMKWDIKDKKIKIYELAGDYFCSRNDYYKGTLYYEKSFNLIDKLTYTQNLLILLKKLSRAYAYTNKHVESIECGEFALEHFVDMPKHFTLIFLYNNSLSLESIGCFNKAIKNLELAEQLIGNGDPDKLIEILNNKGVCYLDLKNYSKALEIFTHILKLVDKKNNIEKFMMTLVNLVQCYIHLDDRKSASKNLQIILDSLQDFLSSNSDYTSEVYFELGNIYKDINNLEQAEFYYSKALEISKKQKNLIIIKKVLCNLIDIYLNLNYIEKINNIEIETFSLSNMQSKLPNDIIYKLINFYSMHNMNSKINELCKFAANFN